MPDETIGVVGAGTMGAGIAQLALEAGHEVVLHDVDEAAIERGRAKIRDGLERRAARLDLDADTIDDWVEGRYGRLRDGHSLDAVAAEADVVVEGNGRARADPDVPGEGGGNAVEGGGSAVGDGKGAHAFD